MTETTQRPDTAPAGAPATAACHVARIGLLLVVAALLEVWLRRVTSLPGAGDPGPVLVAAALRHALRGPAGWLLVVAGAGAAVLALRHGSAGVRWGDLDASGRLRRVSILVAALLAWVYATYPYDFAAGRTHAFDRLLLVALVPLAAWRPVALLPFVLVTLPLAGQFAWPLGGFSWASPILPVRVLLVVASAAVVRSATTRVRTADAVFLLCCLVAAHYWVSGLDKLRLGWLAGDDVAYLLPATYAAGWLAFLDGATIGAVTARVMRLGAPLWIGALVLECGALFALAHRSLLRALLAAWILLHVAIFAISGILFWEWMLLDAAVLMLLFGRGAPAWPIFTRHHFALSLVLVGGGVLWFRPVSLAWLDAPASYAYRIAGVGASGRTYGLHPRFFAPYDYPFTLGDFGYLHDHARLPVTWGATRDRTLVAALEDAASPADVLALEARLGVSGFDAVRADTFDAFVRRFVAGWNDRAGYRGAWTAVAPPPKLWTFPRGARPDPDDPIARVVVTQVTSYFDGRRYLEIRERPVRTIEVSAARDAAQPATTER